MNAEEKLFICERNVLMSEMRYFQSYMMQDKQDVEILVHCDIKIFDWLLRYAKRNIEPKAYKECNISVSNVLALLISSAFLEMDHLVIFTLS